MNRVIRFRPCPRRTLPTVSPAWRPCALSQCSTVRRVARVCVGREREERLPIHHAVLGLLADGPSYGYELKGRFEEAVGPQWGELNIGHLYQVLDRLVRDGLVTRRGVPQRNRPDRVVYRLTRAGREELNRWLGQPVTKQGGYRDDFILKLFAASRLGEERLRAMIRT